MDEIINIICNEFGITYEEFFSNKRIKLFVALRRISMLILNEHGFSIRGDIRNKFGYKHRRIVNKYISNTKTWIISDTFYSDIYKKAKDAINREIHP